jgi:hypothetical protein
MHRRRSAGSSGAEGARPIKQERGCKKEDTMSNFEFGNVRNQKDNLELHAADLGRLMAAWLVHI